VNSKFSRLSLVVSIGLAFALLGCSPKPAAQNQQGLYPDEKGFYLVSATQVPEKVRQASGSVFRVLVPLDADAQEWETSLGRGPAYRLFISVFSGDEMMAAALDSQIAACEKVQGLINVAGTKCRVPTRFSAGSGFLAGNGHTLWTAAHVLFNLPMLNASTTQKNWPVYIFDADGKLIVDPNVDAALPLVTNSKLDYVSLQLPKDIGAPLQPATASAQNGDRIFALGYPTCTGCTQPVGLQPNDGGIVDLSDRSPQPNSDGKSLLVSMGRVYGGAQTFETSVDVIFGNSGGPGLNANGEVVGIAVDSGKLKYGNARGRLGIFVFPSEMGD
jgi:S1-C subfamily serine protease